MARSQGVHEVVDDTYEPMTLEDREVFKLKNEFVYTVLNRHIQTDSGKSIIRKFENTLDGRRVYQGLVTEANNSTAATISSNDIRKWLKTSNITT